MGKSHVGGRKWTSALPTVSTTLNDINLSVSCKLVAISACLQLVLKEL